jgi:nucleotide-binding universal stress UspA family protein
MTQDTADHGARLLEEVWLYVDLDSSAHAAMRVAVEVCLRRRSPLRLVAVAGVEEDPAEAPALRARLGAILRDELRDRLGELAAFAGRRLGSAMVEVDLLDGEVGWHTLVGHAAALGPALVVAATDAPFEEDPLGSTCRHLTRKCTAPLWCVPTKTRSRTNRVLVAVDAAVNDERVNSATRNLLLHVAALFDESTELHVVHAWHVRPIPNIESHFGANVTAPLMQARRDEARSAVETVVSQTLGPRQVVVHCLQGEAGVVVPALADHLGVDVVAFGNTARHRLPGFLIGHTAETFLGRLKCGIVVVKSPGFASPVPPRMASRLDLAHEEPEVPR